MSSTQLTLLYLACFVGMLLCRCVPMYVLKGRDLSDEAKSALALIPPAAFAALVANDLVSPGIFAQGLWPAAIPFIASALVAVVAYFTRSLVWSALAGVACFALLMLI